MIHVLKLEFYNHLEIYEQERSPCPVEYYLQFLWWVSVAGPLFGKMTSRWDEKDFRLISGYSFLGVSRLQAGRAC